MFGFKIKKVTTKKAYTIESLYAAIREHEFSGGWSSFSGVFGKKAKQAEKLTEITAQELDSLGL